MQLLIRPRIHHPLRLFPVDCALLLALLLCSGCGHQTNAPTAPTPVAAQPISPQAQQTKQQMIQNDTGMPEAEKAAIMRSQAGTASPAPGAH